MSVRDVRSETCSSTTGKDKRHCSAALDNGNSDIIAAGFSYHSDILSFFGQTPYSARPSHTVSGVSSRLNIRGSARDPRYTPSTSGTFALTRRRFGTGSMAKQEEAPTRQVLRLAFKKTTGRSTNKK